ncbi:hypothetical protein A2331_06150 [Candidatus Falkowbacteria bacterium RIFOXYB2_FULL_34_18]|uniref:Aspartyl/glutamyl-tRNA(Asn/Gln) amidotransferase subunit C n=1 Tax=Candidatus Falkowbacteria bacterium RIFOXYD2_FULL_34_120 TaxID=1798007 RepID=A0A1F5TNX6_9BACT|nr:MAG: hypothetical protein A2331_06150 [Candidatus Falkowbacteria bacterium RIFOXYB2_FULL_34_18]OGF28976.1 MAG: hypothetical protein A2500_01775 [Candidatus Falkowbacteria bacterium RIFOXYC12_FULL_34_55]OGF35904.1 MAG: hypothetical protein A2466_02365 [Candidatus Falkowbacteria bacterium RIFOXYC2_FULL_34_220]OGF38501.1 MAG: hypothetical protein A2515_03150 [Candidatus Falkowbacteria bacterium RIFOXYD12_FULL_34_57]OGF40580.1 MAG: hypothetical protein A2531_03555 [Candidatus Falkowbacteria bact
MELTNEQIKYISSLAKLNLNEEEINIYKSQLSNILGYVNQLSEINTVDVNETINSLDFDYVLREDVVEDWNENEKKETLGLAPKLDGGQIMVRKIL